MPSAVEQHQGWHGPPPARGHPGGYGSPHRVASPQGYPRGPGVPAFHGPPVVGGPPGVGHPAMPPGRITNRAHNVNGYRAPPGQPIIVEHPHPLSPIDQNAPPNFRQSPHIPLAKCRVLYLGSAVPLDTTVGIESVQTPLRDRYPIMDPGNQDLSGIDAWLTVFSSGILMQYVGDNSVVTWFPISSMHVAASVRCCAHPAGGPPRFEPLDSPEARVSGHPPLFAAIMRRTEGVKVLECHSYICKSEQGAMALVQACTHAYEHKEGWAQSAPPREFYQVLEGRPGQSPPSRLPLGGTLYTGRSDLIKNYSVQNPENDTYLTSRRLGPGPVDSLPREPPPPPPIPVRTAPSAIAGWMPVPPTGYFDNWDRYANLPYTVFPGPYMSQEEYDRTHARPPKHDQRRERKEPRSPERRTRPRDRHRASKRSDSPRRRAHSHEVLADYGEDVGLRRHPRSPPTEYLDEFGNRYYRGRDDEYDYRGRLPSKVYEPEPKDHGSDLILYAGRYQRHLPRESDRDLFVSADRERDHLDPRERRRDPLNLEPDRDPRERRRDPLNLEPERDYVPRGRGGPNSDFNPSEIFLRDRERESFNQRHQGDAGRGRYPRNDREFGNSIQAERRAIGDLETAPDPYKINDFGRPKDGFDMDMFRGNGRPYDDLETTLGYFP